MNILMRTWCFAPEEEEEENTEYLALFFSDKTFHRCYFFSEEYLTYLLHFIWTPRKAWGKIHLKSTNNNFLTIFMANTPSTDHKTTAIYPQIHLTDIQSNMSEFDIFFNSFLGTTFLLSLVYSV